eukprot:1158757-Pelagomonas_calceolata.AAC.4
MRAHRPACPAAGEPGDSHAPEVSRPVPSGQQQPADFRHLTLYDLYLPGRRRQNLTGRQMHPARGIAQMAIHYWLNHVAPTHLQAHGHQLSFG